MAVFNQTLDGLLSCINLPRAIVINALYEREKLTTRELLENVGLTTQNSRNLFTPLVLLGLIHKSPSVKARHTSDVQLTLSPELRRWWEATLAVFGDIANEKPVSRPAEEE